MSICGLHGRATVRPGDGFATCDRCNFRYNHSDLQWQYQYAGNHLINLKILVCQRCLDTPAAFLQAIILPPDPVPIKDPRPGFYAQQEAQGQTAAASSSQNANNIIYTEDGFPLYTEDGQYLEIDP